MVGPPHQGEQATHLPSRGSPPHAKRQLQLRTRQRIRLPTRITRGGERIGPLGVGRSLRLAIRPINPVRADLDELPGHYIRRLHQIAVAIFLQETEAHGLTPVQFAALSKVGLTPGVDQRTLAGSIGLDTSTIAGVIDRLEARGLMQRNVQAVVLPDEALSENLLGLSFLSRLRRFEYRDGRLVLED